MNFIVTFEDSEAMAHMRQKYLDDHFSFLIANQENIESAGPLFHASSGEGAGGMWTVETDTEEAVHELVKADPFWPTGLRKHYTVLGWKKAFADGKRLIHPDSQA